MSQVLITESKLDNLADALGDKISLTLPATIDEMTEAVIDYKPWTSGAYLDNDGYIRISPNAAAGGIDFDNGYIILDNQIKSSFNDGLYLDPNGSLIISDTACDIENVIIRNNSLILPPNIFPKYKTYSVTENLTYTLSNNVVKDVEENSSLIIDLEPDFGYLSGKITSVTVTMGGVDITDEVFHVDSNGNAHISQDENGYLILDEEPIIPGPIGLLDTLTVEEDTRSYNIDLTPYDSYDMIFIIQNVELTASDWLYYVVNGSSPSGGTYNNGSYTTHDGLSFIRVNNSAGNSSITETHIAPYGFSGSNQTSVTNLYIYTYVSTKYIQAGSTFKIYGGNYINLL